VLDKLGAVDGGDDELGRLHGGAAGEMDRAAEFRFENGTVDFAELFF
jgi:hypothetical protein